MKPLSLRIRFRNGTLLLLLTVLAVAGLSLPSVYRLGGAIKETLYLNYRSIEAAQQIRTELTALELAERDGRARDELPQYQQTAGQSIDLMKHNLTEPGEAQIVDDIDHRSQALAAKIVSAPATERHDHDFDELRSRLGDLIALNKLAMFRADSRAFKLATRLAYQLGAVMIALLIAAAVISFGLGWALLTPLSELTEALRSVSQRKNPGRLPAQRFTELDAVVREFNHMADKIEEYEKLSIERILYEKSKTEAIIEGLGDGIVLLNPERVVSHLNETAAVILGVDRDEALGSPFDDLSCNNPHYLRLREALQRLRKLPPDQQHTEVQLHFQDRDRFYVFKRVPLSQADGQPLGVLLVLQDVTEVREHHRAHARLVSALSVELQQPVSEIASSAGRLEAADGVPPATLHELVEKIRHDCDRLKQMADDLMNLVRREAEPSE